MTPEAIIVLLQFLDDLFQLGGKLMAAAIQKHPELNTNPLPDLKPLDDARKDALDRTKENVG